MSTSDDSTTSSPSNEIDPIELPINQETFKHLHNARCVGMDIGGSLVKIAYSSSYECRTTQFYEDESVYSVDTRRQRVPTLNFIKFETKYIEAALDYMEKNLTWSKEYNAGKCIKATGGGAHKYKEFIGQKLGVGVEKEDEMKCLIDGSNFLLRHIPNEVFTVDFDTLELEFKTIEYENIFPYLLVNIGSGVSILKVESESSYQRVGGSTIGGATLWGLGSLLTDAVGFDEIMELAEKGDHRNVDMLIKDIYGGNYDTLGLNNEIIASTMGKTTRSELDHGCSREEHVKRFKQEDLVKSILLMICYDVTQIASLHARLHGIKRVYFGGYFIRNCRLTMKFLKYGIEFWSQKQLECLFLRHEGYLGAIGAFLKVSEESDHNKYSWYENYAHSSAYVAGTRPRKDSNSFDGFELNQESHKLITCPLLDHQNFNYVPDLIDLTKDEDARDYWLKCFEKTIETYVKQCIKCVNNPNHLKRAEDFKYSYLSKLGVLKQTPCAFGTLTVRSLLDLREHCMTEFGFFDVYATEKREENKLGLELMSDRCTFIECIEDLDKRWHELFRGLLAGNVYDYGAQAFVEKQKSGELNLFDKALNSIDDRLESQPGYTELVSKLKSGFYKCICVFVDNSGFDIILGILPFVVELLKTNNEIRVILCANSKAAINDITYAELLLVVKKACQLNTTINEAFTVTNRLIIMESGSASPCLDLSRINIYLAKFLKTNSVDLFILEGMGRAIHTNLEAKFKCDCLKAAVIKNEWLANRFGFFKDASVQNHKFPVVFKYEKK